MIASQASVVETEDAILRFNDESFDLRRADELFRGSPLEGSLLFSANRPPSRQRGETFFRLHK